MMGIIDSELLKCNLCYVFFYVEEGDHEIYYKIYRHFGDERVSLARLECD